MECSNWIQELTEEADRKFHQEQIKVRSLLQRCERGGGYNCLSARQRLQREGPVGHLQPWADGAFFMLTRNRLVSWDESAGGRTGSKRRTCQRPRP